MERVLPRRRRRPRRTGANLSGRSEGPPVEPNLDGWRVVVHVDGVVDVRTRNGRAIGDRVPELAGLPEALGGSNAILDGELVVGQGQPDDFYRLGPRLGGEPTACRSSLAGR